MASEEILSSGERESFQFFDQKGLGSVTASDVIDAIQKARTHLPVPSLQSLQEGGEWKSDLEVNKVKLNQFQPMSIRVLIYIRNILSNMSCD